ncbi:ABCC2 [Cordylochernes scorpioides]|uniref:ABCC2 n=1 Tax=Cordylochernes scorpioides TaxID=51811 RepID=A0ABY6KA21_9ARAC|nr:ABCC2 [Cordylochernes scorpioides]
MSFYRNLNIKKMIILYQTSLMLENRTDVQSLTLSNEARRRTTLGEMVNLMSVDIQRCSDLLIYLNLVWSAPLQIFLCIFFLSKILGFAVGAGLLVMLITLPVNSVVVHHSKIFQMGQMELKDQRIRMMNEVLSGIKTIKLLAWEQIFEDKLTTLRDRELYKLRRMAYINSFSNFFWTATPFLVSLSTFSAFLALDPNHRLDAALIFIPLCLFNILRFPLSMLPLIITMIVQVGLSLLDVQYHSTGSTQT